MPLPPSRVIRRTQARHLGMRAPCSVSSGNPRGSFWGQFSNPPIEMYQVVDGAAYDDMPRRIKEGELLPLSPHRWVTECSCGRWWRGWTIPLTHTCPAERDANDGREAVTDPASKAAQPRVPTQLKVKARWRRTYEVASGKFKLKPSYLTVSQEICAEYPLLKCGPDTLRAILTAGDAGLLDEEQTSAEV